MESGAAATAQAAGGFFAAGMRGMKKLKCLFTKYDFGVTICSSLKCLLHIRQIVFRKSKIVNTLWAFEKVDMSRKKILWLASWYPNRIHPLNGDFIQRHARAVSLYHDVTVLFVMRDKSGAVTNDVLTEQATAENLTERCIYYHAGNTTGFFSKMVSQLRYRQLFKKAIRRYILQNGKPDLVHVHVTLKAGALALWTKKRYGVPFVITEHWTGFLPEAEDYFKNGSAFFQWQCRRVWRGAASISAVSGYLHGHLKKLLPAKDMRIIPNVVDTAIFQPQLFQNPMPHVRFIHVSGLGYQKNAEAIITAFAHVKEKGFLFELHIIAPQQLWLRQLVEDLNLSDAVFLIPKCRRRNWQSKCKKPMR